MLRGGRIRKGREKEREQKKCHHKCYASSPPRITIPTSKFYSSKDKELINLSPPLPFLFRTAPSQSLHSVARVAPHLHHALCSASPELPSSTYQKQKKIYPSCPTATSPEASQFEPRQEHCPYMMSHSQTISTCTYELQPPAPPTISHLIQDFF